MEDGTETFATNMTYMLEDKEKEPEENETGVFPRVSGILDEDDGDEEDIREVRENRLLEEEQSLARALDREVRDSLMEEEQQSFARIKEGHKESVLPKNTISFIIAAPIWSSPFNLGAALIVLKLSLYALAFSNSHDHPSPLSVDLEVRIVQVLAIFVASFMQGDVSNAVQFVYEGYASIEGHFYGGVTHWGWRAAVFIAFLQGGLGLAAIYELISDSKTVLDVFLNFAAVTVVMSLDVVAFQLATLGFLGESCQCQTEIVSGTYFRVSHSPKLGYTKKMLLLSLIFLVMLGCWVRLIILQQKGWYAPRHLLVQFDDSVSPKLGTFSGIYKLLSDTNLLDSDEFHWIQENSTTDEICELGFCTDVDRWAFFLKGTDECKDSMVTSSHDAEKFDILRAVGSQWFVREKNRTISMNGITIAPICVIGGTACGQQSSENRCVKEKQSFADQGNCDCKDKQTYGVRCEFSLASTCVQLEIDDRFDSLPADRKLATVFSLLLKNGTLKRGDETPNSRDDLVLLYQRPVYVSSVDQDGYDVLFYTGLRWAVTGSRNGFPKLHEKEENVTHQELAIFLHGLIIEGFDAGFDEHVAQVDVLSEPVFSRSLEDSGTPVGLTWVFLEQADPIERVKLLKERSSTSTLLCAICNNSTNLCLNEGFCNTMGQCECKHGVKGDLCQVRPIGDGSCNPFFNTRSFKYDGGDCCESTCSPSTYHCGTISDGDLDRTFNLKSESNFVNMGFQNCSDPVIIGNCNEARCWAKGSEFTNIGVPHATDEYILSASGQMLLAIRRYTHFLAVFDKDSSGHWVQRGPNILSMYPDVFIDRPNAYVVNFITLPSEIYGNDERNHLPVWVVIATPDSVQMFVEWDLKSRSWKEYARPLDLAGCASLYPSRSTSYLDLQADAFTVSDGDTSCLYTTANITSDGPRNFVLGQRINSTDLKSNPVDVNGANTERNLGEGNDTDLVNNPIGVTMNANLVMVWNGTTLRVIDYKTKEKADVRLPGNCSDGLQSVHLSGRSTRYRFENASEEVPRVALECCKNSSTFVYVFTINSTIISDEFMQQPFASLELLPVPTTEVVKALTFSDSLLALAFSTDSATRVRVYTGTRFDDRGGCADEATFRLFGSTFPRAGDISVSNDGLSFLIDDSKDIEMYSTSPRCDSETQVSLLLTLQTTSGSSGTPTFFIVEGRNVNSNVIWSESKGLSDGGRVEAGTILRNEFCINKCQLDHIRVITRMWDIPSALLNRRPVKLNGSSTSSDSMYAHGSLYDISSEDVHTAIHATQGLF